MGHCWGTLKENGAAAVMTYVILKSAIFQLHFCHKYSGFSFPYRRTDQQCQCISNYFTAVVINAHVTNNHNR